MLRVGGLAAAALLRPCAAAAAAGLRCRPLAPGDWAAAAATALQPPSRTFHTLGFAAQPAQAVAQPKPGDAPSKEQAGERLRGAAAGEQGEEARESSGGGGIMPHPGIQRTAGSAENMSYMLMHPVYDKSYTEKLRAFHRPPVKAHEKAGFWAVQALRRGFDAATGYGGKSMSERQWLRRFIFLETVAGVPGMVAGMLRHMRSLRSMRRDHGWIHTLLEEAENERMHLLTFLQLRHPGMAFRGAVLLGQGVFFNSYLLMYILWPRACHSFVGYLEEEAVKTYTAAIEAVDEGGSLAGWAERPAPPIALSYWRLPEGSTLRDLLLVVRADEYCHSHVNFTFSELDKEENNPFEPGSVHVP